MCSSITSNVIKRHYDNIKIEKIECRFNSPILNLRNFNNFVKNSILTIYLDKLKLIAGENIKTKLTSLDIGCGKGGDLFKWRKNGITHLVCADISKKSLDECVRRYNKMTINDNKCDEQFDVEFIRLDCSRV